MNLFKVKYNVATLTPVPKIVAKTSNKKGQLNLNPKLKERKSLGDEANLFYFQRKTKHAHDIVPLIICTGMYAL